MIRALAVLLLSSWLFLIPGCETAALDREEINELSFTQVVAIDRIPDQDLVELTAVIRREQPASSGNEQSGQGSFITLSATGRSVFEARKKLDRFADNRLFWGHVRYFVIGEQAARDNISHYLDFLIRDPQIRLSANIIIPIGINSNELLKQITTGEYEISDRLQTLVGNIGIVSLADSIQINEVAAMLANPFREAYLPYITLLTRGEEKQAPRPPVSVPHMEIGGYVAFRGSQMITPLDIPTSRGLNWATNRIKSTVLLVPDSDDQEISLQVISSRTRIKPLFSGNKLSVTLETHFSSNVAEYAGSMNISDHHGIAYLNRRQETIVSSELNKIISFCQENRVDLIGIGDAIKRQDPIRWRDIEGNWEQIFCEIPIKIDIHCHTKRTYAIDEPIKEG
ncbi:MAG: Ger(x)C family spore germination protein [Syntrophomonadaceae bacterium]|jgi:spore germination protein KC